MEQPCISVLMVNYNQENFISASIESVLNQTYGNLQFIIVDDGSTDSSKEYIQKYGEQDSRIEFYLMEENMHISYATNFGFSKVKGEYLARIDSDDLWEPDKLEKQLAFLKKNPGCRICFTGTNLIDENGTCINASEEQRFLEQLLNQPNASQAELVRYFYTEGNRFTHSSVLMETALMLETGGFHLAYRQLHDFDYWVRIVRKCALYILPERLTSLRRFVHSEKLNTSSRSKTDTIRFYNEYMMIRESYFDHMDSDLFCSAFRELFRKKDAFTAEELECEKAFLLLDGFTINGAKQPILGLKRLARLFDNPRTAEVLIRTYGYTPIDYYKENGQHLFFDSYILDAVTHIERVSEENKKFLSDNEKLLRDNEKLLHDNQCLQADNQKLLADSQKLLADNKTLLANANTLAMENQLLSAQKSEWLKEKQRMEEAVKYAEDSLEEITNSTCWKMTAPVRKILDRRK